MTALGGSPAAFISANIPSAWPRSLALSHALIRVLKVTASGGTPAAFTSANTPSAPLRSLALSHALIRVLKVNSLGGTPAAFISANTPSAPLRSLALAHAVTGTVHVQAFGAAIRLWSPTASLVNLFIPIAFGTVVISFGFPSTPVPTNWSTMKATCPGPVARSSFRKSAENGPALPRAL